MKRSVALALALALVSGGAATAQPASDPHEHAPHTHPAAKRTKPWDKEILELAAKLPIQDGGRVKPLSTYAGFLLLRLRGVRTAYTPEPENQKLTPTAWFLDCLFFPEQAKDYQVFLVQNSDVLVAIGLGDVTRQRRDRYSYAELEPGLHKLDQRARQLSSKDSKAMTPAERQTMALAHNVREFGDLLGHLAFTRHKIAINTSDGLQELFGKDRESLPLSEVITKGVSIAFLFNQIRSKKDIPKEKVDAEVEAIQALATKVESLTNRAHQLAIFPPSVPVKESTEWLSPPDIATLSFSGDSDVTKQRALLSKLEAMERTKGDPELFKANLRDLQRGLAALAEERGQYSKIPSEVSFYAWDFFYKALLLYGLAFVLLAVTWLLGGAPISKQLIKGVWGLLLLATTLATVGIAYRCYLRGRPPVSTLYETILFITATSAWAALAIEWINRKRIALAMATIMGTAGMFLAYKYELRPDGGDTMTSLVAVLDTNFWLATHVTTITLGYAAGLLASLLAHVYLLFKILGHAKDDKGFYRTIGRMVYGVILFSLLFSVVGTILGGIWANYSWGRFWGWDPKENGALLICIWQLAMVHGRLGGYLKDWGMCAAAIMGGGVVVFSWWGVNLLGVGLHSYGFTDGVFQALASFYGVETLFLIVAAGAHMGTKGAKAAALAQGGQAPVLEDMTATDAEAAPEAEAPAAEAPAAEAPAAEAPAAEASAADSAPKASAVEGEATSKAEAGGTDASPEPEANADASGDTSDSGGAEG